MAPSSVLVQPQILSEVPCLKWYSEIIVAPVSVMFGHKFQAGPHR
jgi:hypothetical protein